MILVMILAPETNPWNHSDTQVSEGIEEVIVIVLIVWQHTLLS